MMRRCMAAVALASLITVGCRTASDEAKTATMLFPDEPIVRVLIDDSRTDLVLQVRGGWSIVDELGTKLYDFPQDEPLRARILDGKMAIEARTFTLDHYPATVTLMPATDDSRVGVGKVPYGVGWWWESKEDRVYEGCMELSPTDTGQVRVIGVLPIERYLLGVVPSEIGSGAPLEAMKAQAVAARSETVVALRTRKYEGPGYDICSDVNCQAYSGATKRTPETDAAVMATRGLVIASGGEAVGAYYASNCGGHSEDSTSVWPGRHPGAQPQYWSGTYDGPARPAGLDLTTDADAAAWIAARPTDAWCNPDREGIPKWTQKNFRWERVVDADDVTTMLLAQTKTDIGRVTSIQPISRGVSGRIQSLVVHGEKGSVTLDPELTIRRMVVPPLKSSCFVVEPIVEPNTYPTGPAAFRFRGAGYGHGVGMCQTGAMGMALAGHDFEAILTHYYRGVDVQPAY